jgi:hypothetical protein
MSASLPSQTTATLLDEPATIHAALTPQQAAAACVAFWNDVLAAEGSFADDHSAL